VTRGYAMSVPWDPVKMEGWRWGLGAVNEHTNSLCNIESEQLDIYLPKVCEHMHVD